MRAMVVAGLICVAGAGALYAGPDETADRFMNDPVSMMDWGVYRTEQYLKSRDFPMVSVFYDWDRNRVVIQESYVLLSLPESAEEDCKEWFRSVRVASMVNPNTGEPWGGTHSKIGSFFRHNGFGRKIEGKMDSDVIPELDKLILLQRTYWIDDRDGDYTQELICEGSLLSSRISISRL